MEEENTADESAAEDEEPGSDDAVSPEEHARARRRLILLVTPIVVLFVTATVASALTPALASKHPLLLITLEARNRNLVLARHVDFVPFLLVAITRRMLTDPLYFLLGHYYGDRAVRWLEEKLGWGPMVRVTEKFFSKASYPMVFLFPGAIVCAMAGATGMSFGWFMVLNLAGTVTVVLLMRAFGDVLSGPVDALLDFFGRYTWQTTAVTIALVVLSLVLARIEGKAEIPSIDELEKELEGEESGTGGEEDAGRAGAPDEGGREPEREG